MERGENKKTKILFFAWGDSIHARRRIKIFTEDPSFDVGVVSNFAYDFENAKNYYLSNLIVPATQNRTIFSRLARRCRRELASLPYKILAFLPYLILRFFSKEISLEECARLFSDILLVRRYAREFKPDVIFLQTLMYPCYLTYFLSGKFPTIITFWNGDVTWWAQWSGMERAFKKRIVLHGVGKASAITVNSKSALEACSGYGVDSDKVKLIRYPGVNLELFKPASDSFTIKQRLKLQHKRVVLCPRGLGGYLNSDVIIESIAEVVEKFPDTLFLFISGVGTEKVVEEHLKRAADLGITSNIRMDGKVSWDSMPSYYHAADVMVSVSSNDSLPNCMLEAMACGVPVVMGDIPSIREWVKDADNGYLVPVRDSGLLSKAILKVFNNPDQGVNNFIKKNIDLVNREVNSKVVADSIKQLVRSVSSKSKDSQIE